MKLCRKCSETVSLIDIVTNSKRMTAVLIEGDETCDDCGMKD